MRHLLLRIALTSILASGFLAGCGEGLQTFSKYGISFEVSEELKLEEYHVDIEGQVFQKGTASYDEGAVLSAEKNFVLLWLTTVPEFTQEERRVSILTTPNIFESVGGTLQGEMAGGLSTQQIAGFEVTSANMRFTLSGWEAPGIAAIWYCPSSQRTVQLILINEHAEREMRRFVQGFCCGNS